MIPKDQEGFFRIMSRSRRFARIFLILTFPFWFPRILFWLLVEFFQFHFSDWFPSVSSEKREAGNPSRFRCLSESRSPSNPKPILVVLNGGKAHNSDWDIEESGLEITKDQRVRRLRENKPGLRLIGGSSEKAAPQTSIKMGNFK